MTAETETDFLAHLAALKSQLAEQAVLLARLRVTQSQLTDAGAELDARLNPAPHRPGLRLPAVALLLAAMILIGPVALAWGSL